LSPDQPAECRIISGDPGRVVALPNTTETGLNEIFPSRTRRSRHA
jgi:hypothetical protein